MSFPNSLIILITSLLVACSLPASAITPFDTRICTAIGCGFTLQIELDGNVPADFVLTVADESGHAASVHCINGTTVYDDQTVPGGSAFCGQNSVSFLNFAPQQATITVRWVDGEISQSFQPIYTSFRPNGPQCEPECRTGTVILPMRD